MAFFMPVSANIKTLASILVPVTILLLAFLLGPWAHAAGIQVRHVTTALNYDVIDLSASLEFELSEEAIKALDNGVALDLVIEIEAVEQRRWLWNRTIAEHEERFRLERQALSKQYLVTHQQRSRSFLSLSEALQYIGTIQKYPLVETASLENDKKYEGRLRAWLDIESLPAPMRPAAHVSSQWQITSAWHEWPINL